MPVAGRKPKPQGQARGRNKPAHDWTEVPDVPYSGEVPRLPRRRGGWSARTKRKWAVWASMPHCSLWSPSDWDYAVDSLEVAAAFHEGDLRAATELRNREKVLGTTADYRRDLRVRYVDPPSAQEAEEPQEGVTSLDDYRDLYGGTGTG